MICLKDEVNADVQAFENMLMNTDENVENVEKKEIVTTSEKTTISKIPGPSDRVDSGFDSRTNSMRSGGSAIETGNVVKSGPNTVDPPRRVIIDEEVFVLKREWAIQAENDVNGVYVDSKRTKCIESIADLPNWVKENIVAFPEGKMFETLLMQDDLFNDPGLENHPEARPFVDRINERHNIGRKSNSMLIGFRMFARSIILDVFKEKSQGLALRNLEIKFDDRVRPDAIRKDLGRFLDEILATATRKEDSNGESYLEIDRMVLEGIKNRNIGYTTENRIGTYDINVYTKDVKIKDNQWLIRLLHHVSFAWDNFTMMRMVQKASRTGELRNFSSKLGREYGQADSLVRRLLRNPAIVKPGQISTTLLTPFNTSWRWCERTLSIESEEVWNENNRMSVLKTPISIDQMLEYLTDPIW